MNKFFINRAYEIRQACKANPELSDMDSAFQAFKADVINGSNSNTNLVFDFALMKKEWDSLGAEGQSDALDSYRAFEAKTDKLLSAIWAGDTRKAFQIIIDNA